MMEHLSTLFYRLLMHACIEYLFHRLLSLPDHLTHPEPPEDENFELNRESLQRRTNVINKQADLKTSGMEISNIAHDMQAEKL